MGKPENWPRSLLIPARGEPVRAMQESSPWWQRQGRTGRLTNPATTQPQNQDYVLAYPNIHPICDLLEQVGGLVLWTQDCRISQTPGSNMMASKIPGEGPVYVMQHIPRALKQANDSF